MSAVSPDTPDNQRGAFNPQVLIFEGNVGGVAHSIGVPPNAETLVLLTEQSPAAVTPQLTGATTGLIYPGVVAQTLLPEVDLYIWYFDAAPTVDPVVELAGNPVGETYMWMYADAGVHLMVDTAKLVNKDGSQYVVATVPNTIGSDHPPNELTWQHNNFSGSGVLLPNAGDGSRYRVFAAQLTNYNADGIWQLFDEATGNVFLTNPGGGSAQLTYPPSGLPMSENGSIDINISSGGGTAFAMVAYTLEDV